MIDFVSIKWYNHCRNNNNTVSIIVARHNEFVKWEVKK